MLIKSIEVHKNNSAMATVHLDDYTSFCLPLKRIAALNLDEGKTISVETLEFILTYEVFGAAKSAAVSYLALKLRTVDEINKKLATLGYEEELINKVIDNLIEINYLDDYKYAIKFIAEKTKLKPKSKKMLSMELSYKGITDDVIYSAFEEIDLDEDNIVYELLKKKFSRNTSFDDKLIQKMRSFLLNRGFDYQQISKAISKFLPEE